MSDIVKKLKDACVFNPNYGKSVKLTLDYKASFDPNVMLRAASWGGDGKDVACLTCSTELTVHNIASVDEDGNARCKRCMS